MVKYVKQDCPDKEDSNKDQTVFGICAISLWKQTVVITR